MGAESIFFRLTIVIVVEYQIGVTVTNVRLQQKKLLSIQK